MDFPSLCVRLLPKLPSMDLQNALSTMIEYHDSIPHSIISDRGTHFTAKEVKQQMCSWPSLTDPWSYHVPHRPEAAGLVEKCNDLSKIHLEHQLGGNTLQA